MDCRPPSQSSSDETKLIDAFTLRITELVESHSCLICHEVLDAPVRLPCAHVFCSLCIRRHLSRSSACPYPICRKHCTTSDLVSLRHYDATLEKVRMVQRIPVPSPKRIHCDALPLPGNLSRATLVQKLSSVGLASNGSYEALQNRYREFVLRFNAASDSAFGAPKHKVLDAVKRHEAALSEPQKFCAGFSERSKNELAAQQGDSFEELVRKTKRRKLSQTPASASQQSAKRNETKSMMPVEQPKKCVGEEANEVVRQDRPTMRRTNNPLQRSRRPATAQSDYAKKTDIAPIQNPSSVPSASSEVALRACEVNIRPEEHSLSQGPPSLQKLTQVTPPSAPNLNLTEEQMERIRRNKMAAMERRRQNSQTYVRRLPFTDTQEASSS